VKESAAFKVGNTVFDSMWES